MCNSYRILDLVSILFRANIQAMLMFFRQLAQVLARCQSPHVRCCGGIAHPRDCEDSLLLFKKRDLA